MFKADLYYAGSLFKVVMDIIKREEGIVMYWCILYGTKEESFCCIRIDDNPLTVTSSTILSKELEKAVMECIEDVEWEYAGQQHKENIQAV